MKIKNLKYLSIILAVAFVLSVVPMIPSNAAQGVISFSNTAGDGNYYCASPGSKTVNIKISTGLKGRLVIAVDGTVVYDKVGTGARTVSKTLSNYSVGEHSVTAEYIYSSGGRAPERCSTKLRVYKPIALTFATNVDKGFFSIRAGSTYFLPEIAFKLSTHKIGGKKAVLDILSETASDIQNNQSNRDYVKTLYRAVLEREGETSGVDWWTNQLDNNYTSRPAVFQFFVNCDEFHDHMNKYDFDW